MGKATVTQLDSLRRTVALESTFLFMVVPVTTSTTLRITDLERRFRHRLLWQALPGPY